MDLRLDGKRALVTGASSGLGWRFATVLAEAGARVTLAARRTDRLATLRAEIDAAGGRGTSARVTIIIADASLLAPGTPTPAPAKAPSIVVTGITCGPNQTVKVDFEVTSPGGVVSVEVKSTHVATEESKLNFTAPYALTVQDTLWLDEETPDFLDRPHQVNVLALVVGQPNPVGVSVWEPGPTQRCPGHFEGDQHLAATLSTQALWIARLNTNCRAGPGTSYGRRRSSP